MPDELPQDFHSHIHEDKCHSLKFYQGKGATSRLARPSTTGSRMISSKRSRPPIFEAEAEQDSPTGVKWGFVPKQSDKPKYLAVNADESEPGTFKDRLIMEKNPHLLLEGIIIRCKAVGIHHAYIYIRGEFVFGANRLQNAIDRAYSEGILGENCLGSDFKLDVTVHRGAGAYICGEETGMLTSIEGDRGQPKLKPPSPLWKDFSAARPWSTTSRPWPTCPTFLKSVQKNTERSALRILRAPNFSASVDMWRSPESLSSPWAFP